MSIDLHIHSHHSDGTYSPEVIVRRAREKGLTAVSITDHDTAAGTAEALIAGEKYGVEVVPGIELSVDHHGSYMHILGYFFDHEDKKLIESLAVLQDARLERNKKIVEKLQRQGVKVSYRDVLNISLQGQTGRPHIATALCKKGVVKDINQAFEKYLKKGASAYVSRFIYNSEEAIEIIRQSGGIAVLAHPIQIDASIEDMPRLLEELIEMGLGGVEAYYPSHSKSVRKKLKFLAKQYGIAVTGGSDYHGQIRPGSDMAGGINLTVPDELLDKLKQKWIK